MHSEHISCGGRAEQLLLVAQFMGAIPKYKCRSLNLILRQFFEDMGLSRRGFCNITGAGASFCSCLCAHFRPSPSPPQAAGA